jgi:hypothetical protein
MISTNQDVGRGLFTGRGDFGLALVAGLVADLGFGICDPEIAPIWRELLP